MMIAVITYGTALFALMISQWRGETVSVSVSVKEREKKKNSMSFFHPPDLFGVYVTDVFVLHLCGQTCTERVFLLLGNLSHPHFL